MGQRRGDRAGSTGDLAGPGAKNTPVVGGQGVEAAAIERNAGEHSVVERAESSDAGTLFVDRYLHHGDRYARRGRRRGQRRRREYLGPSGRPVGVGAFPFRRRRAGDQPVPGIGPDGVRRREVERQLEPLGMTAHRAWRPG